LAAYDLVVPGAPGGVASVGGRPERQPVRPVAAQVEVVLEVDQAGCLELVEQRLEGGFLVDGTDKHQVPFHAELVRRQAQGLVEGGASEPGTLEGRLANEECRIAGGSGQGHGMRSPLQGWVVAVTRQSSVTDEPLPVVSRTVSFLACPEKSIPHEPRLKRRMTSL